MRTTLDIDEKILSEVAKITRQKNKSKAVSKALEDYIREIKIGQLKELSGKVRIIENWGKLREMELNE